jgi:hypothetical protein
MTTKTTNRSAGALDAGRQMARLCNPLVRGIALLVLAMVAAMAFSTRVGAAPAEPDQTVVLCYTQIGAGQNIKGRLPGDTADRSHWAGIFNVTVDGRAQQAFCTDFLNDILEGACYRNSTVGVVDPNVACTIQYYPPRAGLTAAEAAARQSVIWYYSDGWRLSSTDAVYARYAAILADVQAKIDAGQCAAVQTPALDITPTDAVNLLEADGNGGYLASSHVYTVTLNAGSQPVPNHDVTLSTNVGVLAWQGQSGAAVIARTDSNGKAVVTISHNAVATATITAQATVVLPVGTRIDPGPLVQKMVLSGSESFTARTTATKHWVAGPQIVIKKFHDVNANGSKESSEALIDWTVRYREVGATAWTTDTLGADGTLVVQAAPDKRYEVCEVAAAGWQATTPTCVSDLQPTTSVMFGNVQLPALLVQKFHDLNGNGQREGGEAGLDGWGFQVFRWQDGQWSSSYSGVTTGGGAVGWSGVLLPFIYRVDELAREGWYASTPASQQVGVTQPAAYRLNFGNLQPAALMVVKEWYSNGEPVTPPAAPARVCIKRTGPGAPAQALAPVDGQGMPLSVAADGAICQDVQTEAVWGNLWPGVYAITESAPAGWVGPANIPDALVLSGQTTAASNAVVIRNHAVSAIGDFVWHDLNGNGIQDVSEPGLGGVTVALHAGVCPAAGDPLDNQATDDLGGYLFDGLPAGDYCVKLVDGNFAPGGPLAGYQMTIPNAGSDDTLNSKGDPATRDASATLAAGAQDRTVDFGLYQPACLGDLSWIDSSGDQIYDPAQELVLSGVVLRITDSQSQEVAIVATGPLGGFAPGAYRVGGLRPDTYTVTVILTPAGYLLSTPNHDPAQLTTLASGQCDLDIDFPFVATTGVDVTSFTATRQGAVTTLRWQTQREEGNTGFHIWRARQDDGVFGRLTAEPVPSQSRGDDSGGFTYTWRDDKAVPGIAYWYSLEITPDGQMIGPVADTPARRAGGLFLPLIVH